MKKFFNKLKTIIRDKMYLRLLMFIGKTIFGDRWKGAKSLVTGLIVLILGLWESFSDSGILAKLCDFNDYFCNIEQTSFYGALLVFIGTLQQVLRVITDTPIEEIADV